MVVDVSGVSTINGKVRMEINCVISRFELEKGRQIELRNAAPPYLSVGWPFQVAPLRCLYPPSVDKDTKKVLFNQTY